MKTKYIHNNNCNGNHCWNEHGEVRVLPTGGDSNAILCRSCYVHEMQYRVERNKKLGNAFKFKLPKWEDLEVYEV